MRLRELMVTEVIQIAPDDSIARAAKRMRERAVGCLVATADVTIKGILTDRDLLGCIGQGHDPNQCKVSSHMSRPVIVLPPEENLLTGADVMRRRRIKRLPIAEAGKLLGIVSLSDLASFAASELNTSTAFLSALISTQGAQARTAQLRTTENGSPEPGTIRGCGV
jgi:signal-transduction protein with cAMP-binding, CBS, and nucleotidyltransferase domain